MTVTVGGVSEVTVLHPSRAELGVFNSSHSAAEIIQWERSITDPNPAACLSNRPASVLRTCAQISTMNTPHVP